MTASVPTKSETFFISMRMRRSGVFYSPDNTASAVVNHVNAGEMNKAYPQPPMAYMEMQLKQGHS
ncbi:hypothetical protein KIN20_030787 [Parelaphostrongylus tenuis]|uniref:Uncharacterized protein n=1 Tax=Parelaphostrongylus tenuis TaxID=148309 RepID=A0AAD5WGN5_PARTN|nr:hypothetical protein KIN20_030787 [Parelaphostrongylus tenuis]